MHRNRPPRHRLRTSRRKTYPPAKFLPTYDSTGDFAHDGTVPEYEQVPQVPGYEILGELGRGGMGVVFKARQVQVNRFVALKMILGKGFASPEARMRFLLEGEVLGRLQHPNIVQIYEVGTQEGQPYFALEYVEGGTLAAFVKEQPLAVRTAAELVETLARAMHCAHCNGVIHRDLKPANVLRTRDGTVKITDFGIAKQTESGPGLTGSGVLMGTPQYMAPEQAERKALHATPATDVYALGVILYELLSGRPPFVGESVFDVLRQVTDTEPPSLHTLKPGLPRDLATICHKCLQKEPGQRYASAEALAEDLRRFREDRPIHARRTSRIERAWRWCRRNPAFAALALVTVLLLIGGTITSALLALWALRERDKAEARAKEAKEARDHAIGLRADLGRIQGFMVQDWIGLIDPALST
jgi:serine/threonine-protein kinase